MKALKAMIFLVLIVVLMASPAMAGLVSVVNSTGGAATCSGSCTYSSASYDSSGNLTLVIGGTSQTCTNTQPSLSWTTTPPAATVGQTVTASYSASDADGQTVTVTANYGTASSGTWSWTPTAADAGSKTIVLTANDGQSCNATRIISAVVSVTDPNAPPPTTDNCTVLTSGVAVRNVSIGANADICYKFTLTKTPTSIAQVSLGTNDWSSNQDMVVKKGSPATVADYNSLYVYPYTGSGPTYWYKFRNDSNETFYMYSLVPDTYYILVHNVSPFGGRFELVFSSY